MSRYWIFIGLVLAAGAAYLLLSPGPAVDEPSFAATPTATLFVKIPAETEAVEPSPTEAASDGTNPTPSEFKDQAPPSQAASEFSTDFSRHTISYEEVLSGGPPKDGIPALDAPTFISAGEANTWLQPEEPVVVFQIGEAARAYPLQILTWHEIVNDMVGGVPVVITFCPLCNTAIAFERTFAGQVLDFGTTGRLRYSNLIMYDRQTETWWQQATGEGLAGEYAGRQLTFLPAPIISWADFLEAYPDGQVLSRETGFSRAYGRNPYTGYDDINSSPFLFRGPDHTDRLPAMARVLTVDLNEKAVAYPYDLLAEVHVVNDTLGDTQIVVIWEPGTASALDSSVVADGRDVGAANAFVRDLDGQPLTFRFDKGQIQDDQTGSIWNVLGESVAGELAGRRLQPVVSINHFWFSWAAFRPETRIYQEGG